MSLSELTTQLSKLFAANDYESCVKLFPQLKLELIKNNLLIPSIDTTINPSDLVIARSILEIGALVSINLTNVQDFTNYITQLKAFYELKDLPVSKNQNKLMSLHLLLLLTQDDLAAFHVELEKFKNLGFNIDELETDEYLSIPIKFEKWIIDGNFNKIFEIVSSKDKKPFPAQEFYLFEKDLLDSIRLTIASNIESSYTELPLENLKLLLYLKNIDDTNFFIEHMNWTVEYGIVNFEKSKAEKQNAQLQDDEEKDEKIIIKNTLGYGKEMESIV